MQSSDKLFCRFIITSICIVLTIFYSTAYFLFKTHTQNFSIIGTNGKPIYPFNRIEIYAHRGGRGLAPENTLMAYNNALKMGVDYVDMDVNMTKDGVLIVYHNTELNPDITRNERGQFITKTIPIRCLTYKAIQRYNVGTINPKSIYKSFFPSQSETSYSSIPTLAKVIDFITQHASKRIGFQIEIKVNIEDVKKHPKFYKKYIATLYHLLKEKNIINRTEVQSFAWPLLVYLQSFDRHIKTAYITGTQAFNKKLMSLYDINSNTRSIPKMIKAFKGACWNPLETQITQADIEEAHRYGIKVVTWSYPPLEKTDFNTRVIKNLIRWHVDGIITDRPDILRSKLVTYNYNVPKSIVVINVLH